MYMPHYLHMTVHGMVTHRPENPQGLVIVSERDHTPLIHVDEVSDDEAINLFIGPAEDRVIIPNFNGLGCYEVLV